MLISNLYNRIIFMKSYQVFHKSYNQTISLDDTDPKITINIIKLKKSKSYHSNNDNNYFQIYFLISGTVVMNDSYLMKKLDGCVLETSTNDFFPSKNSVMMVITVKDIITKPMTQFSIENIRPMHKYPLISFVPTPLYKLLAPEVLYLLVGPQPIVFNLDYEIRGPPKFVMTMAKVMPGHGAELHKHLLTTEIFVVIKGKFRVDIENNDDNDDNDHDDNGHDDNGPVYLDELDTIVISKNSYRKFTNIGDEEGILIPIVIGADDEAKDIIFPKNVKDNVTSKLGIFGGFWIKIAQLLGLQFEDV